MQNIKLFLTLIITMTALITVYAFPQNDFYNTVVKEYDFHPSIKANWDNIKEHWMKNEYPACLKKHRLTMTCSGCSSIFIRIVITIDNNGKIASYEKLNEKICGRKADKSLEKCFLEYFKTLTLPPGLRNIKIETMLGTGLKC